MSFNSNSNYFHKVFDQVSKTHQTHQEEKKKESNHYQTKNSDTI
jgi:hypothetical protein